MIGASSAPVLGQRPARSERVPRLLIVEEALRSTGFGHWYEYIKAITEGCRAQGIEVELLVHKNAEPTIIETLRAQPELRYSVWDKVYENPSAWRRYMGVLRHNFRLSQDVGSYLSKSEPFDVVLAPTNLAHHVLGWHRIAKRFGARKFGRLTMIFVNTPGRRAEGGRFDFPINTKFMQMVLRRLNTHYARGIVTLAAETQRAAEQFQAFCGARFALFPHVVNSGPMGTTNRKNNTIPVLGSFGFARHEKGTDLLQQAASAVLGDKNGISPAFIIQWGKDFQDGTGRVIRKAPGLTAHPKVKFIDRALNSDEYLDCLRQTDGIVLPYRSHSYYDRVSRVAIEAVCEGLPFVYPRQSWLEDLAERCGAGVGFEDGSVKDLERALREFVTNISALRRKAADRCATARGFHSPQRFKKCLFGEADDLSTMVF